MEPATCIKAAWIEGARLPGNQYWSMVLLSTSFHRLAKIYLLAPTCNLWALKYDNVMHKLLVHDTQYLINVHFANLQYNTCTCTQKEITPILHYSLNFELVQAMYVLSVCMYVPRGLFISVVSFSG